MYYRVKSKKAVSIMVGYVLLVTFAVIIGMVVYQWMKTYVPQDELNCPDGVSLFIEDYTCSENILTINLRNNGKFNIGGYHIYASDSPDKELAIIDLSKNNTNANLIIQSFIKFEAIGTTNLLEPNEEETHEYDLTGIEDVYLIEIIPRRLQEEKNRNIWVTCKGAKIREKVNCDIDNECIPDCAGKECGEDNNCGISCGTCDDGFSCDANGQCFDPLNCDLAEDPSLLGICGDFECGTAQNGTCGDVSCGTCALPHALSACDGNPGNCILSSCDIGWANCSVETPDGCETALGTSENCGSCGDACGTYSTCTDGSCTCDDGYIPTGTGDCELDTTDVDSCGSYCALFGYTGGVCQDNPNKCVPPQGPIGGIYIGNIPEADTTFGNNFCPGDPYCCCTP